MGLICLPLSSTMPLSRLFTFGLFSRIETPATKPGPARKAAPLSGSSPGVTLSALSIATEIN